MLPVEDSSVCALLASTLLGPFLVASGAIGGISIIALDLSVSRAFDRLYFLARLNCGGKGKVTGEAVNTDDRMQGTPKVNLT